jgi:hypothetical protein
MSNYQEKNNLTKTNTATAATVRYEFRPYEVDAARWDGTNLPEMTALFERNWGKAQVTVDDDGSLHAAHIVPGYGMTMGGKDVAFVITVTTKCPWVVFGKSRDDRFLIGDLSDRQFDEDYRPIEAARQ